MNQLAQRAQLTAGAISRFERGEREPTPESLRRLVTVLDISADWLLFGESTGAKPPKPHDPHPNRTEAAKLAGQDGVFDTAIRSVLREPVTAERETWSVVRWVLLMKTRELEMAGVQRPTARASFAPVGITEQPATMAELRAKAEDYLRAVVERSPFALRRGTEMATRVLDLTSGEPTSPPILEEHRQQALKVIQPLKAKSSGKR